MKSLYYLIFSVDLFFHFGGFVLVWFGLILFINAQGKQFLMHSTEVGPDSTRSTVRP